MRHHRSRAGRGPHPPSATLHSPHRTPLFALHRHTMRRRRSRAGQQPASTIRDPSFATPHPTFRIAQTHDAAPQEPRGPATRIHIRNPPFATLHPTFRIAQTHDAAPQEPCGPQPPGGGGPQLTALRLRALRRLRPHPTDVNRSKARPQNLTHQMRIAPTIAPASKPPPPAKKHRCRKIRHRCVRVFKSSFRVFRAAPGPQSKPSRKQRSPKARRTTSRKTMPPARSACKR